MSAKAQPAARVNRTARQLMKKLEQAVKELDCGTETRKEKEKTETGEITRQITAPIPGAKGIVDTGVLKQLTSVLKDLQDILLQDPDMDERERQMKLQRLERDLSPAAEENTVTVVLEGELENYAG